MTLAEYRKHLGLNKRQMAEQLDVSFATWAKWELFDHPKGRARAGLDDAPTRCRSINVSLTPAAHTRWAAMPAGQRSKWVSALIEEAP